jgi:alkanesulfonate monooxygenase SsuD/methylene tetrahydromethanopterin reductase-like flavin-dependent oxidoreductase (luciferase family)
MGVVLLQTERWEVDRERWQRAESLGFHTAWTYDHLSWRTLKDGPWFAMVPLLAAVAQCTSTIRIGPLVASPNYRHPVPFAKEIMTLDELSGGRLTLGFGSGGTGYDATVLGNDAWTLKERTDRFIEFTEEMDLLLREMDVSFRGKYYAADHAMGYPGCVQSPRVPFALAGNGPKSIANVVKHGQVWVTNVLPSALPAQIENLEAAGGSHIDRLLLATDDLPWIASADAFDEYAGLAQALGMTDLAIHWPRADSPFKGPESVLDHIASRMHA